MPLFAQITVYSRAAVGAPASLVGRLDLEQQPPVSLRPSTLFPASPCVCRELDLTETAVRKWVAQAEIDAGRGPIEVYVPTSYDSAIPTPVSRTTTAGDGHSVLIPHR